MKVILVAFVVIAAFVSNAQGQDMAKILPKIVKKCLKQTGTTKEQILDALLSDPDDFDKNPEITDAAKCFFICIFDMAFVLDANKCYDCEKGKTMTKNFMKGDLQEVGDCFLKGIEKCCPTLQKDDCCKNHYQLIQCMYPMCGEMIAQHLTGLNND